jgi:hypothetical protein
MAGGGELAARAAARLTRAGGRAFGLQVGAAFLALAAIAAWRGHDASPVVLGVLGALFGLGGLLAPARMGPVYAGWMRLALALSKVTTPIVMSLVYLLVFTPLALVMRLVGRDALGLRRARGSSKWVVRAPAEQRSDLERQF